MQLLLGRNLPGDQFQAPGVGSGADELTPFAAISVSPLRPSGVTDAAAGPYERPIGNRLACDEKCAGRTVDRNAARDAHEPTIPSRAAHTGPWSAVAAVAGGSSGHIASNSRSSYGGGDVSAA